MKTLFAAIGLLTAIRVPVTGDDGLVARSAIWFPIVGLLIGLLLAGGWFLLSRAPPLVGAGLIVLSWAAVTGGLHLDGLADSCDALFVPASPERRLEILRDPRTGAFGAAGLCLFLILKVAALESLWGFRDSFGGAGFVLVLATVVARWLVLIAARQPSARASGMAASLRPGATPPLLLVTAFIPLLLVIGGGLRALAAAAMGGAAVTAVVLLARARLNGVTGDVLGFAIEAAELAVLLSYALSAP